MRKNIFFIIFLGLSVLFILSSCVSKDNDIIGDWVNIKDNTKFAKIYKSGEAYSYEDSSGKYPATYRDGILKINTGMGEATAVYDKQAETLVLRYLIAEEKFKRGQPSMVNKELNQANINVSPKDKLISEILSYVPKDLQELIRKKLFEANVSANVSQEDLASLKEVVQIQNRFIGTWQMIEGKYFKSTMSDKAQLIVKYDYEYYRMDNGKLRLIVNGKQIDEGGGILNSPVDYDFEIRKIDFNGKTYFWIAWGPETASFIEFLSQNKMRLTKIESTMEDELKKNNSIAQQRAINLG